jgi:peptidoglycan/LPS O-acetylase OafA/YrhL
MNVENPVSATVPTTNLLVGYIPQLTGVRAIAAYMVYFHHFPPVGLVPPLVLQILKEFHTGVGLFFVLSGFLIFQRYFATATVTREWWAAYIRNRVARIYPMYFLITCLWFANRLVFHHEFKTVDFVLNITFLRGFSYEYLFTGVSQGWTLTVEECFYFSAPLIFVAVRRWGFLLPLGMIYCTGFLVFFIGDTIQFKQFFTPITLMVYYTFFGRCFEFFCGMWLAKFLTDYQHSHHGELPTTHYWTWVGVLGMLVSIYAMSTFQSPELPLGIGMFAHMGGIINNLILPVCYTMVYYGLIVERSHLRTFLATGPMVLLGKSSYIYYLIHMGIVQALVIRVLRIPPTEITWQGSIIQFILLNLIAIALFHFVEEPLNHVIRKHWRWGLRTNILPAKTRMQS